MVGTLRMLSSVATTFQEKIGEDSRSILKEDSNKYLVAQGGGGGLVSGLVSVPEHCNRNTGLVSPILRYSDVTSKGYYISYHFL
jgi:hypothetical protein